MYFNYKILLHLVCIPLVLYCIANTGDGCVSVTEDDSAISTLICNMYKCFTVPMFNDPPSTCTCQLYGFSESFCADYIFQDDEIILTENLNINFTSLINSRASYENKSILGYSIHFLALNSECHAVRTYNRIVNFTIINTCPNDKDQKLKDLCQDPTSPLPVIDYRGHMNFAFRNVYCALCHGVSEDFIRSEMLTWNPSFHCEDLSDLDDMGQLNLGTCATRYQLPEATDVCSTANKDGIKHILNNECIACLEQMETNNNTRIAVCSICRFAVSVMERGCMPMLPSKRSISTLFTVPTETEIEVKINGRLFKSSQICKDDQNFDLLYQRCRSFLCSKGQFAKNGRCQDGQNIFLPPQSQPYPNGTKYVFVDIAYASNPGDFWSLVDIINALPFTFNNAESYLGKLGKFETATIYIESDLVISKILENLNLQIFPLKDNSEFILRVSNFIKETDKNISCVEGIFQCLNTSETYFLNSDLFALVEYDTQRMLYPVDNILFNLTITRLNATFRFSEICVCFPAVKIETLINCTFPLYKYEPDEYKLLPNGDLELHKQIIFEQSKFHISGDHALVCYDPNQKINFVHLDNIQTYLSMACTGMSIIFLIITIIFYGVFTELRNLPGKLTIGLSVFLILAQGLLFVPDLGKNICKYVAAFTHYCWLSVFLWMSSIACNMLITFHPGMLQVSMGCRGKRAFKSYCCLCLIVPGLLCGTLLLLDVLEGEHFHMKYGLLSCSWMSDKYGYIFTFFVPVGVTLVFNLVCFCITLFYIEQTMKTSEVVAGRKRDKGRCKIYIRLSSVMGFAWVFGFIASFSGVPALWYVYVILNGLQGVFIFLSFCVNFRTRHLLTSKFSGLTVSSIFGSRDDNNSTSVNKTQETILNERHI